MQSCIDCICLTFLHCAFSNVCSKRLHKRRQSRIGCGCICLAFLHCAFSNVSSNRLHEKMYSYIGGICLTSLHCAFSNVSLNRLFEKRYSHIGCICMIFLHCAFSNVSSNHQHEKMHIRVYHKNTFFKNKISPTRQASAWGLVWRNPKGFLISTMFRGSSSHFRFDHFYIVDFHSTLTFQDRDLCSDCLLYTSDAADE